MLDIVASYHYMQFQGSLMNQTWENGKKPSFGHDFGPFGRNSGRQFIYLFIYFFQKSGSSVTRYHGQLSSCTISEKINDPVLRKLSDGRTDEQTVESDFIGRCLTNVERLKIFREKTAILFKKSNLFGQTLFTYHPAKQFFRYHVYIFSSLDIWIPKCVLTMKQLLDQGADHSLWLSSCREFNLCWTFVILIFLYM